MYNRIVALFSIVITLALAIPGVLFSDNQKEFSEGFLTLVLPVIGAGMLGVVLGAWTLSLIPTQLSSRILALSCALSALLYLQSNFLVWDYGAFDGNGIDWSEHAQSSWIDLSVWGVVILLSVLFHTWISKKAAQIGFLVIILQLLNLVPRFTPISTQLFSQARVGDEGSGLFELSSKRNIVVVLLDMFEGPAFSYIIKRDPEYAKFFQDFTYFRNTTGSFPTTFLSIPAILSGRAYDNSQTINTFLDDALIENSIPSILTREGYQVDLVTLGLYCARIKSRSCRTLAQSGVEPGGNRLMRERAKLFDIALFRTLPQVAKVHIYNDELWFLQSFFQKRKGAPFHLQSIQTVERFAQEAIVSTEQAVFKFIHLMLPHTPFRYDSQCNFTKEFTQVTVRDYSVQSRCALRLASRVIQTLKTKGVYENSSIVVLSDHGFVINFGHYKRVKGFPEISKALPLLLYKPLGATGELKTSEVPAALTDVATTIAKDAGLVAELPGENLFELESDSKRARIFRHYKWKNDNWANTHLPPMQEYAIKGDAWKMESWSRIDK